MKDSGERRRSGKIEALRAKLDARVPAGSSRTSGAAAARRWLHALGLAPVPRWFVEISMYGESGAWLGLHVYAEEWGLVFEHAERTSWIRVTDIAFVHGRDDFRLRDRMPDLLAIHGLIAELEHGHGSLRRERAAIRTNLPDGSDAIHAWLAGAPPAKPRDRVAR